ncbi:ATP-binding cassette sub-family A member 13 [Pogoniulus pusillus]|uniref:ATP-binding cassette sub-family A member 13 n=1 Tax=Pogoniulus pusillus TaxID=488313 RepID=UPI0030B9496A
MNQNLEWWHFKAACWFPLLCLACGAAPLLLQPATWGPAASSLCHPSALILSLTEILWPCVLFLILAAVRFQEPPKYKATCYLEARDLPSQGLYPFVRSLFCNVGSRCRSSSHSAPRSLRTAGLQSDPQRLTGPDLDFMKGIEELAKEFTETTEKALSLEKLWEEKFSGLPNVTTSLTMDLNEVEEMISRAENLYKQPYFWSLLRSLPHLGLNSLYTEAELVSMEEFLEVIENTLAELKNLGMMPLGQSVYEVVRTALSLAVPSGQDGSSEGLLYNLSLGDVLWNPHSVRAELISRFGFDDLHAEKVLSYTAQLAKIPTDETLEQFVCSALSGVPEDQTNRENNEENCITPWPEAKLYLVQAVSKIKLYAQVFEQWFSSSRLAQKLLLELEGIIADLMSQLLDERVTGKPYSEINALIQQLNEKSDVYFSEGHTASHDLILMFFKEFFKAEEDLRITGGKAMDHVFHLEEMIEEIIMLDFSDSSNQSVIEHALNNAILWMKSFAEGKESATNFSAAVSEIHSVLHQHFQPLQRLWMKEKTEFFWQIAEMVLSELDSRLSHLRQVEEEEIFETLSRILLSIPENKIRNRPMLLLRNILTDWPELKLGALNHHVLSKTSHLFLSNATFLYKTQQLEEIVHEFFKDLKTLNSTNVASLVPMLWSLYQNDLLLYIKSNSSLLAFLYDISEETSSSQAWSEFQSKDHLFDFLSGTLNLFWNFTSKPLCEKLLTIYNYTELQAKSLSERGKKEMQVILSTLSSLKTWFVGEELQAVALCYLEEFLVLSPSCLVNNGCTDFNVSNTTSGDDLAELYNLLLPLDSVLSNITNSGGEVTVPSALCCTLAWLQTWTEVLEVSKILSLNSTFFECLRSDLAKLSESLLNTTQDKQCNATAMVTAEATAAAMNLLKVVFDLNSWKDFEAFLAHLQSIFDNAADATGLLQRNSLESALEMMGVMVTELQKSVLRVANGELLNSWLDTFISEGAKGEDAGAFSIGNALLTLLKLSQKELGMIFTELRDMTAFFSQDKYMVCISILQNITKLILDNTLEDVTHSQRNYSCLLNSFVNIYSTVAEIEDCNKWIHGLGNLSEKYKSHSHLESAKHILFLLESLGNLETDTKVIDVMGFVDLIFNLILPECSLPGSDVICVNAYVNIIAKTVKLLLPEFHLKDDISVFEFIFALFNSSGGQTQMAVNDLVSKTDFNQSVHGFNRTSWMFLNPFHHIKLPSIELLAEIEALLKNKAYEIQENNSSHLHPESEPFLHKTNASLLMEFFQYVISELHSDLQGEQRTFLQKLIERAALSIELVKKALQFSKSSSFTDFPLRDKEFLKHAVALVQNMRKMDVEFLVSQFRQAQRSLDAFFKSIKPLCVELGITAEWWDAFENNLCRWNLTGFWQTAWLFEQGEFYDAGEVFQLLLDVVSLTDRLAGENITEALGEVYAFILTQEGKMSMFTEKEFSTQIEDLLMLLQMLTDVPDQPAEASLCFSAAFCWVLTTAAPPSEPTLEPCDFVFSNSTLSYNTVVEVINELKIITLEDSSLCAVEDIQVAIIHNLTCFFQQIQEWNSILLQFSELRHVNDSALRELLEFWNELSLYVVPLQANKTHSTNCSSTPKRQVALQIVGTLGSMPVAEMEVAKGVLEQLDGLYGDLSWDRHSGISLLKAVLSNMKNMTSEISGLLGTEAVRSFLSVVQPLMMLSPLGNQTYSMLMMLSSVNGNSSISDLDNFWFPVVTSIEGLLVDLNVGHLVAVIDEALQLLQLASGQSSSTALDVSVQHLNTSSVHAMLRTFEDIQENVNSFLCECDSKNDSKIMYTLILLMSNESSSDDLLLVIEDIIDFLELYENKSREDDSSIFFVHGHLREKTNNTPAANSMLLNRLLRVIDDLAAIEEALHTNNSELQIADIIDSLFDHAQYRQASTQPQNRTLEIMQEMLQRIFLSITEQERNKTTSLLKDLHTDLMAEMRSYEVCKILQRHLDPTSVLLLQKLQFAILNILNVFSEDAAVRGSLSCAVTKCKGGFVSRLLLSFIEGVALVQDRYQDMERMWPVFNSGDCQSRAFVNQKLFSSLESFLKALKKTSNDSCECQLMVEDIQRQLKMVAENLELQLSENPEAAFPSSFNLLNDVKVKECIQNLTQLRLDIGSSVNISEEAISTILEANISYSKVFYSAFVIALTRRCDEEILSLLLNLPENNQTSLLVEELCSLPALDLYTIFVLLLQNVNLRHVVYEVKVPSEMGSMLDMLLDVVSSISSLLDKVHHVMEKLPVFLQGIQNLGVPDTSALQQLLQGGQFRSSAVGPWASVVKAVCKEEWSFFSKANLFIDAPRTVGVLQDNMAKYSIPEDSTPFCLRIYQEILQSSNGALLWTFLKPLLHGKILYNSNLNMIDLVMKKANFTFGFVENLKTYSETWLRMSKGFKTSGSVLTVSRLQEALQSNFIKHFIESHLDVDMEKLLTKMQVYEATMKKMFNSSESEQIDLLSQLVVNLSSCVVLDRFQPLDSVEKLEKKAHELMQQNNFLASIIFDTPKNKTRDSSSILPPHVSYTLRTNILYSMRTDRIKNPAWKAHPQKLPADGFKYNYIFVPLQDIIERAIISAQTGTDISDPAIQVQAMPYPCHTSDLFLNNIGFFFPLMMMLSWMVSVAGMVRRLVYEREIHLEEYMKTMGVHPAIHFFAWFLENIIVLTISSCTLAIILKASGIFTHSNRFLIFLFLVDFGLTVITLSYFLGAFFSSANTGALCASLVYMISFLPYILLLVLQNQLSFTKQIIMCLLSTTAFGQGVFFITFFEGQGTGIQWNNMHLSVAQGGDLTFGCMCWMMLFDSVLYYIGGWYFSNIIPGTFGLKKQWYFPVTVSYWENLCGGEKRKRCYLNSDMFFFNENLQEQGSAPQSWKGSSTEGNTVGVVLLSLTKEHPDGQRAAVKDLSLTFHRGQITALLGPNGAGKTTLTSLLTGLYPPSSGTAVINGKDIRTDLAAIRREMGVCPQYDVLFNTLTVREHLLLYGSVKAPGWTKEQLNQQTSGALEDVGLSQHQYKPVASLSGGMKRRLSIAISFIGNSKTVVLDEPTSGVDPCSRRSIWDVLLKYKAGCTLIFTTHHLDEAEVLSDRIVVLQHGQLRCCGSPSYLRETYGQGHSLTLTKKPSVAEIQDPKHVTQITSLVQTHIPEAFLKDDSGTELTYMIPERADKTSLKGLFQALDQSLPHLHMTGYGISDTTLEEVFLKLLQDSEKMPCTPQGAHLDCTKAAESAYPSRAGASSARGARLVLAQLGAVLKKRFQRSRRDWRGSVSHTLLPVLFVALAMALFTVKPLAVDYPSLKLTPGLDGSAASFFSIEDDNLGNLSQILLRYFSAVDHTCMHSKQGKNNSCWEMESASPNDSCGCVAEQEMCPTFNTSAPYVKNKKGHVLYNLSGFLLEEYLVRASNKARYGGWSFGGSQVLGLRDKPLNNSTSKPLAKVWYNQKGFHSLPSYLNELNNYILWLNLPPDVDWRQYGITLYSQPYGGALLDEDKIMEDVRQCGVALCVMLGFSILTASIGSAVVKDRVSGTKRLQHIAGLGYRTYWLANFCCDMLLYMVPVTLCVGVISTFQLSAFTFRKNLAATVLLLILFGYATLPWMYLVSRFFSSSDVAFISYISLNFVFGLCTMLVTLLPRLLAIISKVQSFQNICSIFKWVFIVFPQFCLGQGLIELSYNQIKFDLTSNFGIDSYVSPFEMNFLGWIFVEMALQGTILLLLRLCLHWDLLQKPRGQCSMNSMNVPCEDVDVGKERQRLFDGRTAADVLLLYNLRKCYGGFSKKNTAVESISLGIARGECFGLLGTNGAGKSTTFKMLTGDIIPSSGRAVVRTPTGSEVDILSAGSEGILIGYCPQQDALDELLTGWEHLYYYCTLRGIPKQDIRKVAEDLVDRLHLRAHADKLVRTYSAGTKRKLSTAVALVGKPQILLLDEPSSGMDPCSKRYLWKTILREVQDGCAAVLTSHSMEECEALCTRLAIMVNGSFKCLGSPQHIKNRFGDGYSIKVWLSKERSCERMILDCLQLHFPGAQFKGQHLNLFEYHVPQSQGCLAELFRVLENHKAFLQIKHYSIGQTTLEQVFINFATQQHGISHSSQESPVVHNGHLPV